MSPHFTYIDLIVLAAYFVVVLGIGYGFRIKSSTVDGFTAAGRNLPGWLTGLSILGTYVSSISFLALPGKAFIDNWNPFAFSLSLPISTWIAVRWFLPFYRKTVQVSAYEHLEERFGPWARIYASLCYLLTQLARMGTVMYLMALPMSVLLGWDIRIILLFTGISVTIYTFLGGLVAVIWTDAIQTIILITGALVCAVIMVVGLPEGPGQLFQIAAEHDKFSLGSFGINLAQSTFWVTLVYGLIINLQNFGIDQNYIQRYFAAKSDREARKSIWLGGLMYIPVSAIFFFIGTALFAYYQVNPQSLPVEYQDPGMADSVFPYFIVSVLPTGITGLLIAAVFAAAMSTVSTSLNSSATIILNDYYQRLFNRNATEKQSMRMLHRTTVVWGALGTLIALAMTEARSALDAWWTLAGIFGGGTLGLFLLGFISRRPSSKAAACAVGAGVVIILWMTLSPRFDVVPEAMRSPFHSFLIIVFGTATILGAGFVFTALFKRRSSPTSVAQ
ncbi:MAG TPA: sodium:solute symporter [Oceanipulchritudo sp.]|nr:sodium:solute symporter [Oceanipulchritudo sp.]